MRGRSLWSLLAEFLHSVELHIKWRGRDVTTRLVLPKIKSRCGLLPVAVVAVLVVPVSWVSHGGLEQTRVTVAQTPDQF